MTGILVVLALATVVVYGMYRLACWLDDRKRLALYLKTNLRLLSADERLWEAELTRPTNKETRP